MKPQITLLLDTNFWLDLFLSDRPGYEDAARLIEYAVLHDLNLIYAGVSAKDVFYIVQRRLKQIAVEKEGGLSPGAATACNESAWACINYMTEWAAAAPVGEAQIWFAQRFKKVHSDLEDDLIISVLETTKANYLVTSDRHLAKKAPVGAFSPREMLEYLSS